MTHHIQEKAMLVNLSISSWTASKKDKAASKEIKTSKGALDKAGWFNKRLIDPSALHPIGQIEGRARDYHYKLTLRWGDNGDRMLPAMAYMDYVDAMRGFRREFDSAIATFVSNYPALVQEARKMLGAMYEPGDYPDVGRIKERFDMRTVFTPVPDAADFRVDVGDEAVAEIRKSITEAVEQRMHGAIRECWDRLYDVVGKMVEALSDPDRVFRDSLIDNIGTLCSLLPKLNVTNDAALNNLIGDVRVWLVVDHESLRKDKKFRLFTADRAASLHKLIEPWTTTYQTKV